MLDVNPTTEKYTVTEDKNLLGGFGNRQSWRRDLKAES